VVDLVKVLLQFFRFESCGKCTPCRIGTQRALEILNRVTYGNGKVEDVKVLENLIVQLDMLSNCGLGQTSMVPVRDLLKHFRATLDAHIALGVCPSGVCPMQAPVEAEKLLIPI
jgi:NADP-reducing hydrogenase subunit HndC